MASHGFIHRPRPSPQPSPRGRGSEDLEGVVLRPFAISGPTDSKVGKSECPHRSALSTPGKLAFAALVTGLSVLIRLFVGATERPLASRTMRSVASGIERLSPIPLASHCCAEISGRRYGSRHSEQEERLF